MEVYSVIKICPIVRFVKFKEVKSRDVSGDGVPSEGKELGGVREFAHQVLVVVLGVHEEEVVVLSRGRWWVHVFREVPVLGSSRIPGNRGTQENLYSLCTSTYVLYSCKCGKTKISYRIRFKASRFKISYFLEEVKQFIEVNI